MKHALLTALLVCGCQARTPSRAPSPDPKTKEANTAMSIAVAVVTCHGQSPAKPPNQTYPCTIDLSGIPTDVHWLLVPRSLDEPLLESMPIDKLELVQTAAGLVYLGVYGEPGFYAVRIDGTGRLTLPDWRFTTAHDFSTPGFRRRAPAPPSTSPNDTHSRSRRRRIEVERAGLHESSVGEVRLRRSDRGRAIARIAPAKRSARWSTVLDRETMVASRVISGREQR